MSPRCETCKFWSMLEIDDSDFEKEVLSTNNVGVCNRIICHDILESDQLDNEFSG